MSKRKRAEEALQKSEEKYRELYETAPVMLHTLDQKGVLIDCNKAFSETIGYSKEEMIGRPVYDFQTEESRALAPKALKKVAREGILQGQRDFITRDGRIITVEFDGYIERTEKQGEIVIKSASKDITERKQAEEALQESEERLTAFMDSATDTFSLWDSELNLIRENEAGMRLFPPGTKEEDIYGKSMLELFPDIKESGRYDEYLKVIKTGKPFFSDDIIPHPKFGEKYMNVKAFKVGDGLGLIVRDITERKRVEERIREISQFPEKNPNPVFKVGKDGEILYHNNGVFNYVDDAKKVKDILPANYGELVREVCKSGEKIRVEHRYKGNYIDYVFLPISKKAVHIYGRDITERKEAEEALRESEERLRKFMESATDGFVLFDSQLNYVSINETGETDFGVPREKIIGKNIVDIVLDIKETGRYDKYKEVIKTGEPFFVDDIVPHPKFGGMHIALKAFRVGDGLGIITTDITERMQAEEALVESEEKFRRSFDDAAIGMSLVSPKGEFLQVNPALCKISGYSEEELLGNVFQDITHPEDLEIGADYLRRIVAGEIDTANFEKRYIHKDGRTVWVSIITTLLRDAEGNPLHSVVQTHDITERKRAEEEMKRRLMKFRLEEGNLYLVKEPTPALSIEAFKDLLNVGYSGLVISKTPREEFEKNIESGFEFVWLAERGGRRSMLPKFREIELKLENLPGDWVVLIDRLDYLIFKNGFRKTLSFVHRLSELVYFRRVAIIMSIDPSTLKGRELRLLEKETKGVEPRYMTRFPDELLEVLRFIYQQNNLAVKPSHTDIGKELEVSRPTARKRVERLISTGFVRENVKGNKKVLELTERGLSMFLK